MMMMMRSAAVAEIQAGSGLAFGDGGAAVESRELPPVDGDASGEW